MTPKLAVAMATERQSEKIETVEQVIQLIRSWIDSARLKEGDRLPTERALSDQFGLNRNLVRRAFLQLDKMGLINRHVGRGTFVGASPSRPAVAAPLPQAGADYSPAAILQTRLMLEPRIAALAVANATLGDLQTLQRLVLEMGQVPSRDRLEQVSMAFAEALAAATHNALIETLAREVTAARQAAIVRRDQLTVSAEERRLAAEELAPVVEAIRARDPAAAAAAVRRSLIRSTRTFSLLARMELLPDDEE